MIMPSMPIQKKICGACLMHLFKQAPGTGFPAATRNYPPPPPCNTHQQYQSQKCEPYLGSLLSFILTLIKKYIIIEAVPVGPLYNPGGFCGPLHTSGDQTTCSQVVLPALLYGAKILSINWKDKHSYISVLEEANTNRTATTII